MATYPRYSRRGGLFVFLGAMVFSGAMAWHLGRPSSSILEVGHSYGQSIHRGKSHAYTLPLASSQYARVQATQFEIDLNLRILGPSQKLLVETNGAGCGMAVVSFVAPASGSFTIVVQAARDSTNEGRYDLRVSDVRPSRPEDKDEVEAQDLYLKAINRQRGLKAEQEQALALAARAASLWDVSGNPHPAGQARLLVGHLSARLGHWEESSRAFNDAAQLLGQTGDQAGRLSALRDLGRLEGHFRIKTLEIPTNEQFLKLWRALGDRRGIAESLGGLAGQKMAAGDFREGLSLEEQALRLRRAIGDHEGEIRSMEHLIQCDMQLGHSQQAIQLARGILYQRQARGSKRDEAAAQAMLGVLLGKTGDWQKSAECERRAAALHHQLGDISAETLEHRALGGALLRMRDFQGALDEFRTAQSLQAMIEKGMHSPAWRTGLVANYGTARAIVETLEAAQQEDPTKGYDREAFGTADQVYGMYLQEEKAPKLSLRDIQSVLDADSVLLEYWFGDESSSVWSIDREGFSVHTIASYKEIDQLSQHAYDLLAVRGDLKRGPVTAMRRQLADADRGAREALRALSRHLLTPVASALNHKRVLIVGNAAIQRIPLSLLPDPSDAEEIPLLARHEVTYLPSAGVMLARSAFVRQNSEPWFTIVADPVTGSPSAMSDDLRRAVRAADNAGDALPRLQYAAQEVTAISQFAPSQYIRRFIGPNANRDVVMHGALTNSKFIHFIAHAFDNPQDPELSGLALSKPPGSTEDGFFRLRHVENLRLTADLVVLSACRTARGAEPPFGGVVSLTSGFLRAGAAQVLSTAWKVDDEATAYFMKLFYANLFGDQQRTDAALKNAQLAIAATDRWRAPYYWGGFLLYSTRR